MKRWITVVIVTTIIVRGVLAEETQLEPLIVQSDSDHRGGHVNLEALSARGSNNSLRKVLTVKSLEHIQSAQLLIYGALRDPTDQDNFTFDSWEWIFFSLNGHE